MKFVAPLSLALILTACFTPEDRETAHQHKLQREAEANFIALKRQTHPNYRVATPEPKPTPKLLAFFNTQPAPPSKATHRQMNPDETVYYWQVQKPQTGNPAHYKAAEARYARELAKNPEDLTSEERLWAHEHY